MTEAWEYHVERISDDAERLAHRLKALGLSGWELVSLVPPQTDGELWLLAVLKRPRVFGKSS